MGTKLTAIITSIGCKFNEIFCGRTVTAVDLTLLQHQIRTKTIHRRPQKQTFADNIFQGPRRGVSANLSYLVPHASNDSNETRYPCSV